MGHKASLLTVIDHCQPFFLFYRFFEHIFKHINCPLLGLIFITNKCRPEDLKDNFR